MGNADVVKKHKLTVFLIKEEYTELSSFLDINDSFTVIDVEANGDRHIGKLIFKGGFKSKPSWVDIFTEVPGFDPRNIWNVSSRALFALRHEERWFCFTFGHARHLIEEHAYERNFGLRVALNLCDPAAVTAIDKTNISHIALHSKEQATQEIELGSFEFDNDTDLLRSMTAKTPKVGNDDQETFSGRDSVAICTRVTVEMLADVAKRLYLAFNDTRYKELYPWLDKIREERDKTVIEALNNELVSRLQGGNLEGIWLAIPEVIPWEDIDGFGYTQLCAKPKPTKPGPAVYQDLEIPDWLKFVKDVAALSKDALQHKKVYAYWKDGRPPTQWSIYRCLNAELPFNGERYILNDGDWYNIDGNYVTEVNAFYHAIADSAIVLPPYGTQKEPQYLEAVAGALPDYALMDRKTVMIGSGRSRIEFCDLYSRTKCILHVKKYGGSSVLSHLFAQAVVSGESFLHEGKFRSDVNELLPPSFKLANPSIAPNPQEYTVCLAIMSKEAGPLEIPFFSKVSFRHAVTRLTRLGYKVEKLKIPRS